MNIFYIICYNIKKMAHHTNSPAFDWDDITNSIREDRPETQQRFDWSEISKNPCVHMNMNTDDGSTMAHLYGFITLMGVFIFALIYFPVQF